MLSYHHNEMLELLLTHGADPNVSDPHGTPLQLAIERNVPYDVELLLANGADPDVTAVISAIAHGKTQILELLLDYGADPNRERRCWPHPHVLRPKCLPILLRRDQFQRKSHRDTKSP